MQNSYETFDYVAALRGIHRLQESGASGERQDAYLRAMGFDVQPQTECLPLPDLNRPAFFMKSVRDLVANRKCPSCKTDICAHAFKDETERKEYAISGMCAKCQNGFFDSNPGQEAEAAVEAPPAPAPTAGPPAEETPANESEPKGTIIAIEGRQYQCYAGYTCSLHGQEHIKFIEDEDKHETWGCSKCGAEGWFRVRQYDAFGDEL